MELPAEIPSALYLALAIPLVYVLFFALQSFFGNKFRDKGDSLALLVSGGNFALGLTVFTKVWGTHSGPYNLGEWFSAGPFSISFTVHLDNVSALMLLLVTGITFLVHLFSKEYMKHDPKRQRYWAFLSLFSFSMTGLVLAWNLLLIFAFWELVGFSSYLLIGFWHEGKVQGSASQKAFIVNRIGDVGFIAGMLILYVHYGDLDLSSLIGMSLFGETPPGFEPISPFWKILAGLGLTLGALSKSAQFPLQVWLPDAMAGPTPVSSLIHAATMVAAGVYLLISCVPLFHPVVLDTLAFTGALTALIAALSALTQNDIKGVLAYSTISQLGFMVMGVGVFASEFSLFHLATHAFFKCGLFLTAGAIIHALHEAQKKWRSQHGSKADFDVQDIRLMGGFRKLMPRTFVLYLIFAASLAGLPLFSGFLSKDGLLLGAAAWAKGEGGLAFLVPLMSVTAAVLTAVYISRHAILIFFGEYRLGKFKEGLGNFAGQIKEVNFWMLLPLAVLAVFALAPVWAIQNPIHATAESSWLLGGIPAIHLWPHETWMNLFPWVISLLSLAGIVLTWNRYRKRNIQLEASPSGFLKRLSYHHFYFDSIYQKLIVQPIFAVSAALNFFDKKIVDGAVNGIARVVLEKQGGIRSISGIASWVEKNIVDRTVNGVAGGVMGLARRSRKIQSGKLQSYLILTLFGLLLLLGYLFYFAS